MEFQSLTRRELQSLCKRNDIPANMTNIAMANALNSLEFVEGIEEISQPKETESAESSFESPAKSEVTSPYVPPTGGRTTRRRTIAKEEPQTLQPMTRTRGTARKAQAKNKEESRADATETPEVAAQPSRRRVPVASACRKVESQFKECAEEDEKKGVPLTPVALEVTSRRRGLKKESEVRRVYSTRRSARLAEKNVEILSEVKNEQPEILRSDLFMKEEGEGENVEMNVKEVLVLDGLHEVSDITGVEVETSLEENFKKMDVTEVSSGQKQDMSDENDEDNVKEKLIQNSKTDDPNLEMDQCIDAGDELLSVHCETLSDLDGERADETEPSNGGYVAMTLNKSNDFVEDGDDDVKQDERGKENETNLTNEVDNGEKQPSEEELVGDKIAAEKEVSESVLAWQLNCSESAAVDSPLYLNADFLEMESNPIEGTECGVQKSPSRETQPLGKILCHEVDNLRTESSEKAAEDAPSSDAVENVPASMKNSPIKHFGGLESAAATVHSPMLQNADFLKELKTSGIKAEPGSSIPPKFTEIDSSFTIQLNSLTPTNNSASKASATVKKIADVVSDNKENIGSCGSKLVLTKERVKIAKNFTENVNKNMDLNDLSMRKLTKMLKEKLQITNKSSKDENGNKAITRPALHALPENRLGN